MKTPITLMVVAGLACAAAAPALATTSKLKQAPAQTTHVASPYATTSKAKTAVTRAYLAPTTAKTHAASPYMVAQAPKPKHIRPHVVHIESNPQ